VTSEWPSRSDDGGTQVGIQAGLGHDIDAPTEQILKILAEAHEIEQRSVFVHVHEQIEIAGWSRFGARLGSEHAHVPRAVQVSDSQDVGAEMLDGHINARGKTLAGALNMATLIDMAMLAAG